MIEQPADDESAPYLTQALFLASTMATPATAMLLTAKRERVFEHLSHASSEHAKAGVFGVELHYALLAIADWHGTLPGRHRVPETILQGVRTRIQAAFPTRGAATAALIDILSQRAPHVDPHDSERALRAAMITRRAAANRASREL
jgi:hypothetical protein